MQKHIRNVLYVIDDFQLKVCCVSLFEGMFCMKDSVLEAFAVSEGKRYNYFTIL